MLAPLRSKLAFAGAALYLLVFAGAAIYPMFDRRTFSGLFAVLLGWPWIDWFPGVLLLVAVALNTISIYVVLAVLSLLPALFRGSRE